MKKVNWSSISFFLLVGFFISTCLINCAIVSDSMSPATKQKIISALDNYPEGYESWANTTSKVVLDKTSPFHGFQRVLVSKKALTAYKTGGQYPQGSQLVLEFSEPIQSVDIVKGSVNWIAVMTKDSSAVKTGGWRYEAYNYSGASAIKKEMDVVVGCFNCHMAAEEKDYVFSSPVSAK